MSGRTLMVGAPARAATSSPPGAVYVFELNGQEWQQRQKLAPVSLATNEEFGSAIAINGERALIALGRGRNTPDGPRLAYVFRFNGTAWVEEAILYRRAYASNPRNISVGLGFKVPDLNPYSKLPSFHPRGTELPMPVALVGTPSLGQTGGFSGLVDIYTFENNFWRWTEEISPPPNAYLDEHFGRSISASTGLAIVGAPADGPTNVGKGTCFVINLNGPGEPATIQSELAAPDGRTGDAFGMSVSLQEDVVLIGAPGFDAPGGPSRSDESGAAYVFRRNGSAEWFFEAKLRPANGLAGDYFGRSVALGDGVAVIGAPGDDDRGSESGTVQIFRRCNEQWFLEVSLHAPAGDEFDRMGLAVAVADGLGAGGAPTAQLQCSAGSSLRTGYVATFLAPDADCDGNGMDDALEIAQGHAPDCNMNCRPDACDVPPFCSYCDDCNQNGVPDSCDVESATSLDCNANRTPDECEVFPICTFCFDCNQNGVPDDCDIAENFSLDCNDNRHPDECEVPPICPNCIDCNRNGIPDLCDTVHGPSLDCNLNKIPDECEVGPKCPDCMDCNANGVPDECDLASGTSDDCTDNGIPDECESDCDADGVAEVCQHQSKLYPPERNTPDFGTAVDLSDDLCIVASPFEQGNPPGSNRGAAYAYQFYDHRWTPLGRLEPDSTSYDQFGRSVLILPGYPNPFALVGAPRDLDQGYNAGAVYFYRLGTSEWELQQKLFAPDPRDDDQFGTSMSVVNGMLLVGAPGPMGYDDYSYSPGKVYVFRWDEGQWSYEEQLVPWLPKLSQRFGFALASHSNNHATRHHLLVGAPSCSMSGHDAGAVYAYEYDGRDWLPRQVLLPPPDSVEMYFGSGLAMQESEAMIGALRTFSAVFYKHDGSQWIEQQAIPELAAANTSFQSTSRVALFDSIAAIGSPYANGDVIVAGATFLFRRMGESWQELRKLVPADAVRGSRFGASVALGSEVMIVGVPGDPARLPSQGAAYTYFLDEIRTGDVDLDGTLTTGDFEGFLPCSEGPGYDSEGGMPFGCIATFDFDEDDDIDLADFAAFQRAFGCGE